MSDYEILGVSENATTEEVKAAYHAAVKHLHPDVNDAPNAAVMFRMVQEAYERVVSGHPQLTDPVPETKIVYVEREDEPEEKEQAAADQRRRNEYMHKVSQVQYDIDCAKKQVGSAIESIAVKAVVSCGIPVLCWKLIGMPNGALPFYIVTLGCVLYFIFSIFQYWWLLFHVEELIIPCGALSLYLIYKFVLTKLPIFKGGDEAIFFGAAFTAIPLIIDIGILVHRTEKWISAYRVLIKD